MIECCLQQQLGRFEMEKSATTLQNLWRHGPVLLDLWPQPSRYIPWPVQVAHKELCGLARRQAAEEPLNQQLVQANLQNFSFGRLITEHTNITQIFPSLREESNTHYNNVRTMSFLIFQWATFFLACKSATWGMALTDPRRADTAWSDINIDVKLHIRLFVSVPNPRIGSISILTTELSTKPFTHAPDRDSNNNNYYYYNYQLCRFHQLSTMSPVLDLIDEQISNFKYFTMHALNQLKLNMNSFPTWSTVRVKTVLVQRTRWPEAGSSYIQREATTNNSLQC